MSEENIPPSAVTVPDEDVPEAAKSPKSGSGWFSSALASTRAAAEKAGKVSYKAVKKAGKSIVDSKTGQVVATTAKKAGKSVKKGASKAGKSIASTTQNLTTKAKQALTKKEKLSEKENQGEDDNASKEEDGKTIKDRANAVLATTKKVTSKTSRLLKKGLSNVGLSMKDQQQSIAESSTGKAISKVASSTAEVVKNTAKSVAESKAGQAVGKAATSAGESVKKVGKTIAESKTGQAVSQGAVTATVAVKKGASVAVKKTKSMVRKTGMIKQPGIDGPPEEAMDGPSLEITAATPAEE